MDFFEALLFQIDRLARSPTLFFFVIIFIFFVVFYEERLVKVYHLSFYFVFSDFLFVFWDVWLQRLWKIVRLSFTKLRIRRLLTLRIIESFLFVVISSLWSVLRFGLFPILLLISCSRLLERKVVATFTLVVVVLALGHIISTLLVIVTTATILHFGFL
jgi:hypothetical protein